MWTSWLPQWIGVAMLAMVAITIYGVVLFHERPLKPVRSLFAGLGGSLLVGSILCFYFFNHVQAFERSWFTYNIAFLESRPFPWRPILLAVCCTAFLCGCIPSVRCSKWLAIIFGLCGGWLLGTAYQAEIEQQHRNVTGADSQGVYTLNPKLTETVTHGRLNYVIHEITFSLPMTSPRTELHILPAGSWR